VQQFCVALHAPVTETFSCTVGVWYSIVTDSVFADPTDDGSWDRQASILRPGPTKRHELGLQWMVQAI